MGIVYFGDVERVSAELREAKDELDARYREVLGEEREHQLSYVSQRLLSSRSFYSNPEKLRKVTGHEISGANKFIVASDTEFEIERSGRLKNRKVRTIPLFYISEEGFRESSSSSFTDRRLASYVHEFDHYVWYVLQRVPIYVISIGIASELGTRDYDGLRNLFKDMVIKETPSNEFKKRLSLVLYGMILIDMYEKANRVLDRSILGSIGINVDLDWRGAEREYAPVPLPVSNAIVMLPVGGDPFGNLTDKEVVDRFIKWEDHASMMLPLEYAMNFLQSVKELRVSRISVSDMDKIPEKRRKK